jgi:hypothetical protein
VLNLGNTAVDLSLYAMSKPARNWSGLGLKEATQYVQIDSGRFQMTVAPLGQPYGFVSGFLKPGQVYTLILRKIPGQMYWPTVCQLNDGDEQAQDPLLELTMGFPASVSQSSSSRTSTLVLRPNPASDAFDVAYTLARRQQVQIELADITGRVVESVNQESQDAGGHSARVSAGSLATGSYVVTVRGEDGGVVATGRVVVVR